MVIMDVAMDTTENLGILDIIAIMVIIEVSEIQIPQVLMNRGISINSTKCNIL